MQVVPDVSSRASWSSMVSTSPGQCVETDAAIGDATIDRLASSHDFTGVVDSTRQRNFPDTWRVVQEYRETTGAARQAPEVCQGPVRVGAVTYLNSDSITSTISPAVRLSKP